MRDIIFLVHQSCYIRSDNGVEKYIFMLEVSFEKAVKVFELPAVSLWQKTKTCFCLLFYHSLQWNFKFQKRTPWTVKAPNNTFTNVALNAPEYYKIPPYQEHCSSIELTLKQLMQRWWCSKFTCKSSCNKFILPFCWIVYDTGGDATCNSNGPLPCR